MLFRSHRPAESVRLFKSKAIEKEIQRVKKLLTNPRLAWMFENCFPNTLDTTVRFQLLNGKPDTSVYTGDIHAMWLRDSGAQVFPYIQFAHRAHRERDALTNIIFDIIFCIEWRSHPQYSVGKALKSVQ